MATLKGPVTPVSPLLWIQSWVTVQGSRPLLLGQGLRLSEDEPLAALVGFLPGMLSLMLCQGGAVPEALPTVVTLVGPLLSMSPQMQEQARGPREGFPTHTAGVWLLTGVRPLVPSQG